VQRLSAMMQQSVPWDQLKSRLAAKDAESDRDHANAASRKRRLDGMGSTVNLLREVAKPGAWKERVRRQASAPASEGKGDQSLAGSPKMLQVPQKRTSTGNRALLSKRALLTRWRCRPSWGSG
jgi:hypothetical protein